MGSTVHAINFKGWYDVKKCGNMQIGPNDDGLKTTNVDDAKKYAKEHLASKQDAELQIPCGNLQWGADVTVTDRVSSIVRCGLATMTK